MKIAIINTTYQQGSIGKIANHFYANAQKEHHNVKLYYGRDYKQNHDNNIIKISYRWEVFLHALLARVTGLEGCFSYFSTRKLIKELRSFSPDFVLLGSLLGYFINEKMLFQYLERNNIFSIYCMMDEYPYMGKCCYPFECEKFIKQCKACKEKKSYPPSWFFDTSGFKQKMKAQMYGNSKNIIFTGPEWVCSRARESYILKNAIIYTIDEAIDVTNTFYPRDITNIKQELNIPEENRIVLNVCPVTDHRKGAKYYFEAIEKIKESNITFIQVGCNSDEISYPPNLIRIGYIKDQNKLAEFYSLADVFVCTSLCDTMPNTCLEALACGTPVIGFDISGIPYVASKEYGTFIEAKNTEKLAVEMSKVKKKNKEKELECRNYAIQRYSHKNFFTAIMDIIEKEKK